MLIAKRYEYSLDINVFNGSSSLLLNGESSIVKHTNDTN